MSSSSIDARSFDRPAYDVREQQRRAPICTGECHHRVTPIPRTVTVVVRDRAQKHSAAPRSRYAIRPSPIDIPPPPACCSRDRSTDTCLERPSTAEMADAAEKLRLIHPASGGTDKRGTSTRWRAGDRGRGDRVWYRYPSDDGVSAPSDLPFAELPNLLMTPHSSGVTRDTFTGRVDDTRRTSAGCGGVRHCRTSSFVDALRPAPISLRRTPAPALRNPRDRC